MSNKLTNTLKEASDSWILELFKKAKFPSTGSINDLVSITQDASELVVINNSFINFAVANKISITTLYEDSRSLFSGFKRGVFLLSFRKIKFAYVCLPISNDQFSSYFLAKEEDIPLIQSLCQGYFATQSSSNDDKPTIQLGLNNQDSEFVLKYDDLLFNKNIKEKLFKLTSSFFSNDNVFRNFLKPKKINHIIYGADGLGKELLVKSLAAHPKINKQLFVFSPAITTTDELCGCFQQLMNVQDSIILISNVERYIESISNISIPLINSLIEILPQGNMLFATTTSQTLAKQMHEDRLSAISNTIFIDKPTHQMYERFLSFFKIKLSATDKKQIISLCEKHEISFAKLQELMVHSSLLKEKLLTHVENFSSNDKKSIGLL